MSILLFTGPSLHPQIAQSILPDATIMPPIQCGDIIRCLRLKPTAIIVLDGYFERVAAVWHKEILFALAQGISVYGASSMGALRAAELYPYGMQGFGKIFEWYRDGLCQDDAEVALIHDHHYQPLTTPMVNVHATMTCLLERNLISEPLAQEIMQSLKTIHFSERQLLPFIKEHYPHLLQIFATHYIDQKYQDAYNLLQHIKEYGVSLPKGKKTFHSTLFFDRIYREMIVAPFAEEVAVLPKAERLWRATCRQPKQQKLLPYIAKLLHGLYDLYLQKHGQPIAKSNIGQHLLEWSKTQVHPEMEKTPFEKHLLIYFDLIQPSWTSSQWTLAHLSEEEPLLGHRLMVFKTLLHALFYHLLSTDIFISPTRGQHYVSIFRVQHKLLTLTEMQDWLSAYKFENNADFSLFIMQMSVVYYFLECHNIGLLGVKNNYTNTHWPNEAYTLIGLPNKVIQGQILQQTA